MKIIYITGEPAQGKSTFARRLKGFHFEMDKMYVLYKLERDILYDDFDQSDWTTWNKYPDLEEYKKNYYKILKSIVPDDVLIVDSVTIARKEERDLIEDVFKPDETEMIIIRSEDHKENYLEKFKESPETFGSIEYFNYKNKLFSEGLEPCENTTIYERKKK